MFGITRQTQHPTHTSRVSKHTRTTRHPQIDAGVWGSVLTNSRAEHSNKSAPCKRRNRILPSGFWLCFPPRHQFLYLVYERHEPAEYILRSETQSHNSRSMRNPHVLHLLHKICNKVSLCHRQCKTNLRHHRGFGHPKSRPHVQNGHERSLVPEEPWHPRVPPFPVHLWYIRQHTYLSAPSCSCSSCNSPTKTAAYHLERTVIVPKSTKNLLQFRVFRNTKFLKPVCDLVHGIHWKLSQHFDHHALTWAVRLVLHHFSPGSKDPVASVNTVFPVFLFWNPLRQHHRSIILAVVAIHLFRDSRAFFDNGSLNNFTSGKDHSLWHQMVFLAFLQLLSSRWNFCILPPPSPAAQSPPEPETWTKRLPLELQPLVFRFGESTLPILS